AFIVERRQRGAGALRQPRAQVRQRQRQGVGRDAGGVEHRDAGVARAVVEIEQREFVLAAAGNGVQSVERDEGIVVQRIERLAQSSRGRRERQVGAAAPAALGRRAGG